MRYKYLFILLTMFVILSCDKSTFYDFKKIETAERIVSKTLLAPSSAKYSEGQIVNRVKISKSRTLYLVYLTVDAQNTYGAFIRSHYLVVFLHYYHNGIDDYQWLNSLGVKNFNNYPNEYKIKSMKETNGWNDRSYWNNVEF